MKKLTSRKFLVALGAMIAMKINTDPAITPYVPYIIFAIALLYITCEAVLDKLGLPTVAIESLLQDGVPSTKVKVSGTPADPNVMAAAITATLAGRSIPPDERETLPPPAQASPAIDAAADASAPPTAPSAAASVAASLTTMWLLMILGCVVVAVGCGPVARAEANEPPPCRRTELAKIEADYQKEILVMCKGWTFWDCPHRAAIEVENERRREEWARCH